MEPAPHLVHGKMIVFMSMLFMVGFIGVSAWVLVYSKDQTTQGSIIQTWNNLAIAVGAFWLGSSLGGKLGIKK